MTSCVLHVVRCIVDRAANQHVVIRTLFIHNPYSFLRLMNEICFQKNGKNISSPPASSSALWVCLCSRQQHIQHQQIMQRWGECNHSLSSPILFTFLKGTLFSSTFTSFFSISSSFSTIFIVGQLTYQYVFVVWKVTSHCGANAIGIIPLSCPFLKYEVHPFHWLTCSERLFKCHIWSTE